MVALVVRFGEHLYEVRLLLHKPKCSPGKTLRAYLRAFSGDWINSMTS